MRFFVALFVLITLSLTGCVSTRVGNFATAPVDVYQTMVNDTVGRLVVLYPPARTCFQINQNTSDPFGTLMLKTLRAKGYSVIESRPKIFGQKATRTNKFVPIAQGIPLAYVVDSPRLQNLYRVSVMMGCNTISRAYILNQGHVYPEGAWTHKE